MKDDFDSRAIKAEFSALPSCPICGKPPVVNIDHHDDYTWIWIACKKRCYPLKTRKASLQQAVDSAKSKWRKFVRKYPRHNTSWYR